MVRVVPGDLSSPIILVAGALGYGSHEVSTYTALKTRRRRGTSSKLHKMPAGLMARGLLIATRVTLGAKTV